MAALVAGLEPQRLVEPDGPPGATPVWSRRPDEGSKAYAYFTAYLRLGPHRSVHRAAAQVSKTSQNLDDFAKKFDWVARAGAYDRQNEEQDTRLYEAARAEAAKRRLEAELVRQTEAWELAELVAGKIRELLALPFTCVKQMRTAGPDGEEVIEDTVVPVNTGVLPALAMLMREYNRLSQAAILDVIEAQKQKSKKSGQDAPDGKHIAGSFSFGEKMWGGACPPELPAAEPVPSHEQVPVVPYRIIGCVEAMSPTPPLVSECVGADASAQI